MRNAARVALAPLLALALCPLAALLIGDPRGAAVARGRSLMDAETSLGLHVEPGMERWLGGHPALLTLAGVAYFAAHIGVAGWALVWTWFLRRDRFAAVRDVFVLAQVMVVALYVAMPTAPPRLVEDPRAPTEGWIDRIQSPWAAMPSGHVAFAFIAGATFATLGDRRWLRTFGWLYPPFVIALTMATGHHLWLDALGAAAVVTVAAVARLLPRGLAVRARAVESRA